MNWTVLVLAVSLGVLFASRIAAGCVIVPKPTVLDAYNDADVVVIARAISSNVIRRCKVSKVSTPTRYADGTPCCVIKIGSRSFSSWLRISVA